MDDSDIKILKAYEHEAFLRENYSDEFLEDLA